MTVHTIGNGRVCIGLEGASVMQAFGPTYSSPTGFTVDAGDGWNVRRERPGVFVCSRDGVTVTDWADGNGLPVLFRQIKGNVSMQLRTNQTLYPLPAEMAKHTYMSECHGGEHVYINGFENGQPTGYVSGAKRYMGIRLLGRLTLTPSDIDAEQSAVSCDWRLEGEGTLLVAFAAEVGTLLAYLDGAQKTLNADFTASAQSARPACLDTLHGAQKALEPLVLGVYDTVKAQTAASGGVLAGYPYRLCYLRDNYGVYRGLRAMGAHQEADGLACYYAHVFEQFGDIHNAQGPAEYAFHIHENDDTEITAYLSLILCDYLSRRTPSDGDEVIPTMLTLLNVMLSRQHGQLINGMLPFNGDETYVAGGILSRACLNDGSMEATALYHKSLCEAETVAARYETYELPDFAVSDRQLIETTFRSHFHVDGQWVCNYPHLTAPAYRHGVRACGHGFGIAFRNPNGDYVCRACLDKDLAPIWTGGGQRYAVPAAVLCPAFVDSPLISIEERTQAALSVLENCQKAGRGTGYDLGYVLWALTEPEALRDLAVREKALFVRDKLLSMPDEFGAYSEYYEDNFMRRSGTMCRPWESCVNIAALLRAAAVL